MDLMITLSNRETPFTLATGNQRPLRSLSIERKVVHTWVRSSNSEHRHREKPSIEKRRVEACQRIARQAADAST
jgi:hypothetical protein